MENKEQEINLTKEEGSKKLLQLQSLLLMISETNFETFALMGASCQRSILTLAFELSLESMSS